MRIHFFQLSIVVVYKIVQCVKLESLTATVAYFLIYKNNLIERNKNLFNAPQKNFKFHKNSSTLNIEKKAIIKTRPVENKTEKLENDGLFGRSFSNLSNVSLIKQLKELVQFLVKIIRSTLSIIYNFIGNVAAVLNYDVKNNLSVWITILSSLSF